MRCCLKYCNELGQFLDMTNDKISSPASKKQKKGNKLKKQEPESKPEVHMHELAPWDLLHISADALFVVVTTIGVACEIHSTSNGALLLQMELLGIERIKL